MVTLVHMTTRGWLYPLGQSTTPKGGSSSHNRAANETVGLRSGSGCAAPGPGTCDVALRRWHPQPTKENKPEVSWPPKVRLPSQPGDARLAAFLTGHTQVVGSCPQWGRLFDVNEFHSTHVSYGNRSGLLWPLETPLWRCWYKARRWRKTIHVMGLKQDLDKDSRQRPFT